MAEKQTWRQKLILLEAAAFSSRLGNEDDEELVAQQRDAILSDLKALEQRAEEADAQMVAYDYEVLSLNAEVKRLREALKPMLQAMRDYSMEVMDEYTEPPFKHREMMRRAEEALAQQGEEEEGA